MEDIFFELLQVAIGNRNTLSVTPTKEQWAEIFALSKKQALVAIAFRGVSKLNPGSDFGASLGMDEMTYLKWLGLTAKVTQRNKEMNEACVELCKELTHDGLACCILKGQGNLEYYPEGLRDCRTSGDIDVWCKPIDEGGIDIAVADMDGKGAHYQKYQGIEAVIEYSRMRAMVSGQSADAVAIRYNNTETHDIWPWDVEIHHRPSMMNSFIHNARLQRWCKVNEQFGVHDANVSGCTFPMPTVSFNAIYQLSHIYTHLFDEGIGFRQLLDYYFILRALHIDQGEFSDRTPSMAQWAEGMGVAVKSNEEIMHTLGRFGMKKFAAAVMYVLQTVFEAPLNPPEGGKLENADRKKLWPWMICEPDEKEGKFLLNEIMQAGNFGKYDSRISHSTSQMGHAWEKLKHNLRLLTHYPEEVLWEPFFRVYHWIWRRFELWKF